MGMDYSRAGDWIVAERGFDPEHLGKCESIMCQGNGYLCVRNATDEFNPREQRDLFVAGTFNKFDDNEVTELPNAADVTRLEIKLDGARFSLLTGTVEDYDRSLNLRTGETVRRVVWKRRTAGATSWCSAVLSPWSGCTSSGRSSQSGRSTRTCSWISPAASTGR